MHDTTDQQPSSQVPASQLPGSQSQSLSQPHRAPPTRMISSGSQLNTSLFLNGGSQMDPIGEDTIMTDFSQPGPSRYGSMVAKNTQVESIDDYSSHWPPSAQKQTSAYSNIRPNGSEKGKTRETLDEITEFVDPTQSINADLTPAGRTSSSNVGSPQDRLKGSSRIDKGLEPPLVLDDATSTWGGDSP